MATDPPGTRRQILQAAEELIVSDGFRAATTRAIAERARCAEGSIYRHFPDKHALIAEVVRSRFPAFLELVSSLPDRAGQGSVRATLEEVVSAALVFHRRVLPLVVGPMGNHELLLAQRRHFKVTDTGPMKVFAALTSYLSAEQRLGRVSPALPAEHATRVLMGTCFAQAFREEMLGEEAVLGSDETFVAGVVTTLLVGLQPDGAEPGGDGGRQPPSVR
jgi:AcrR family transcriptional regulator